MQVEEARLQAAASEQRHTERAAGAAAKHVEEVAFLEAQGAPSARIYAQCSQCQHDLPSHVPCMFAWSIKSDGAVTKSADLVMIMQHA